MRAIHWLWLWVEYCVYDSLSQNEKIWKKMQNSFSLIVTCKWELSLKRGLKIGHKINGNIFLLVSYSLFKTRSQLIKAGVKLLIQSKRKNSGSSSCDADYRPPPPKIRATSVSSSVTSPVSRKSSVVAIPCEVPPCLTSPKDEESSLGLDSFQIKTDDMTTSCDEDSESKFSAGKHEVIKFN